MSALHRHVARQILTILRTMRKRVWEAAHVKLEVVTIDPDTTVHTLSGQQMDGRQRELRNGGRRDGKPIRQPRRPVHAALPPGVKPIDGRADSVSYCQDAAEGYEEFHARLAICARQTPRRVGQLHQAEWKPPPKVDAGTQGEFHYQPDGWTTPYRSVALRSANTLRSAAGRSAMSNEPLPVWLTAEG